ncbi:hypothetical protein BGZ83_011832 [Gryganskiella cystojenkinii]|nr:hypothetical protein BGZ83_011832 [Gryganskiella cystojenkinii]
MALSRDNKIHDRQLSDIQYQLTQSTIMERAYRTVAPIPFDTLDNYYRVSQLGCKAPPISASSFPHLVLPKVVQEHIAAVEAVKKAWKTPGHPADTGPSKQNRRKVKRNRPRPCGNKPAKAPCK